MSGTFNKFQSFAAYMPNGSVALGGDTLKVALTNTIPVNTNTIFSNITDLTGSTGYTAGGATVTVSASSQSGGTYKLIGAAANPTWTAGATWNPFQYAVLYDSSASIKVLIGWWDYGSPLTLTNGQTFTIVFDATNGIFQLS